MVVQLLCLQHNKSKVKRNPYAKQNLRLCNRNKISEGEMIDSIQEIIQSQKCNWWSKKSRKKNFRRCGQDTSTNIYLQK